MRSSDVWLGIVYDWVNFSMLSAYVLLMLRERAAKTPWKTGTMNEVVQTPIGWGLGDLILTAGSQHLYERNLGAARQIVDRAIKLEEEYLPMNTHEFVSSEELVEHLALFKDGRPLSKSWLVELNASRRVLAV